MTILSWDQLRNTWIYAGGARDRADIAAAVAMAESGGRSDATHYNNNGTVDNGLWQINRPYTAFSLFDPFTNAKVAIQMSANGTNWRPWCTAYSDAACGTEGGCYMCAGSPVLAQLRANGGSMGGGSTSPVFPDPGQPPSGAPPWDPSRWVGMTRDQVAYAVDVAANYAAGIAHLRR